MTFKDFIDLNQGDIEVNVFTGTQQAHTFCACYRWVNTPIGQDGVIDNDIALDAFMNLESMVTEVISFYNGAECTIVNLLMVDIDDWEEL